MKKNICLVLLILLSVSLFANEEKIASYSITDELNVKIDLSINAIEFADAKFVMYFNNENKDPWASILDTIVPFGLLICEDSYPAFIRGLQKFIEWDKTAKENNVSQLEKNIPVYQNDESIIESYYFFNGGEPYPRSIWFTFERKNSQSRLRLVVPNKSYTYVDKYYFEPWQVSSLLDKLSEKSLNNAKEKINNRKKQQDLFN